MLVALVVAGCGDKSDTYKTEYTKAADQFKRSVDEATAKIASAKTVEERIPALGAFKASIDQLADKLDGLDPPDDVGRLNGEAVDALRRMSGDLGRLQQAAEHGDRRAFAQLAPTLQKDQADLQSTLDEIDQALR
jgi:hypothetical protein